MNIYLIKNNEFSNPSIPTFSPTMLMPYSSISVRNVQLPFSPLKRRRRNHTRPFQIHPSSLCPPRHLVPPPIFIAPMLLTTTRQYSLSFSSSVSHPKRYRIITTDTTFRCMSGTKDCGREEWEEVRCRSSFSPKTVIS